MKKPSFYPDAATQPSSATSSSSLLVERSTHAGTLGLRWLAGGRQIDTVHYVITGCDSTELSPGDINFASASTLSFRIGGLRKQLRSAR